MGNTGVAPVALVEERPASAWPPTLKLRRAKGLEERLKEPWCHRCAINHNITLSATEKDGLRFLAEPSCHCWRRVGKIPYYPEPWSPRCWNRHWLLWATTLLFSGFRLPFSISCFWRTAHTGLGLKSYASGTIIRARRLQCGTWDWR